MRRTIGAAALLLAGFMILAAAFFYHGEEEWIAVVYEPNGDVLRTTEYLNGILLTAQGNGNIEVRLLEIEDGAAGLTSAHKFIQQKGCAAILTNLDYPERFANCENTLVITTGISDAAVQMRADYEDESKALLLYARESDIGALVVLIPEVADSLRNVDSKMQIYCDFHTIYYSEEALGDRRFFDALMEVPAEAIMAIGEPLQAAKLVAGLRHAGYTGAILSPSGLQSYEALGIHAGQASGVVFAAQYVDPKQGVQIVSRKQQQFIKEYTNMFGTAPLFLESYLGADQMILFLAMREKKLEVTPFREEMHHLGVQEGILQIYNYSVNKKNGIVNMVIYKISAGHIEEAR